MQRKTRRNSRIYNWADGRIEYFPTRAVRPRIGPGLSRALLLLCTTLLTIGAIQLTLLLASSHAAAASEAMSFEQKIDPALQAALQQAEQGEHLRVIVHMQSAAQDQFAGLPESRSERRLTLVARLQDAAARSQSAIQSELQQKTGTGAVSSHRSLWIINGIQVIADADTILSLASRPEVAQVTLDASIQLLSPMTPTVDMGDVILPDSHEPGKNELWHLERVRARHVWAGLGVSGTNTTIAFMDTGADWLHPALASTYLGLSGTATPDHAMAWFDAVSGSPEPFDPNGHGTHVAGTASGGLGVGVAPGSRWMAVRILGADGSGYLSDIHAGFQWLLAPGGDPTRAPDIVNGSWSGPPELDDFTLDIQALHAASVITIFAAGNAGPFAGTVRAPANYPGVIAVGATDDTEQVAWFSSRGPSNLTSDNKPMFVAPGMHILSALPDNAYGYFNGTSMATPIVAGIHALLLSAGEKLSSATAILTATARPIGDQLPNSDAGWGLVDAYAAVANQVTTGRLHGQVFGAGLPLAGAAITITTPSGIELAFTSTSAGSFSADLISGTYGLTVSAYGYEPYADPAVFVGSGSEAGNVASLARLPYGTVNGKIVDASAGSALSGTLQVTGAPLSAAVGKDGRFSIELPVGDYELVAMSDGHRLGRQWASVIAGHTSVIDFSLDIGPRILLIDSGPWYGESRLAAYANALQQNDFAYSTLSVRDPYNDLPTEAMLSSFDTVVWSAPFDSPGYVGAGQPLSAFLDAGGHLLISGQNVAALDGNKTIPENWWLQLGGAYRGKAEAPFELYGAPGTVFEGIQIQINELDESGESVRPDVSFPLQNSLAETGIIYGDGTGASLLAGQCDPFRISYFGFGLEDVADPQAQADLVASTFDYFAQPETVTGLRFNDLAIEDLVPPGGQRSYPIELLNLSETLTDTFTLELVDSTWPSTILTETLEIGPCKSSATEIGVSIPADLPLDTVEEFSVVATSSNDPSYRQVLTIRLKTPGHILLVDDDRWYDQSATFKAAMTGAGLSFDFWDNEKAGRAPESPAAELLAAYDFVFWYTGYDWFRPVTSQESENLSAYVQQGGRLFLTSQDYMYYHVNDRLTRDYLGVRHYEESITPTMVYGGLPSTPFHDLAGPNDLRFGLYQNNGDGLVPSPDSLVSLWQDRGYAAGVASSGLDWRTVFWAIPFETVPEPAQAKAMNRITGWLGDLGDTTFVVNNRTGPAEALRTYTLTLRYAPAGPGSMVYITNTLPVTIDIDSASITGDAHYNESTRQVTWNGHMDPGQNHVISYAASLLSTAPAGALQVNPVQIYYADHDLRFEREVWTWVNVPDLSPSRINASPLALVPGQMVTVELELINGSGVAGTFTASLPLPSPLRPMTDTLTATEGDIQLQEKQLIWHGWLESNQHVSATLVLSAPVSAKKNWLPLTATVEDGYTNPIIVSTLLEYKPLTRFMPLFLLE